jgi:hypothetical protein
MHGLKTSGDISRNFPAGVPVGDAGLIVFLRSLETSGGISGSFPWCRRVIPLRKSGGDKQARRCE